MQITENMELVILAVGGLIIVRLITAYIDKFVRNATDDHSQYMTHADCKLHRDCCQTIQKEYGKEIQDDIEDMKRVIFHIGMKLGLEEEVLKDLIKRHH